MAVEAKKLKRNIEWLENLNISLESDSVNIIDPNTVIINSDCFKWLESIPDNSIEAIVTDPPYGVKEFEMEQIRKMKNGMGGIWRIPPSFDGNVRSPLPRFTALNEKELKNLEKFFVSLGDIIGRKLKPGGHMFIASNSFLSQFVFNSIVNENLEFRGEIIRLVRTMRGGDKPKNFENDFPDVCTLPRGCYEPWGIFRKKLPSKMTVGECLKTYGTGGLRRINVDKPFEDVISSIRTPALERGLANHPSLKPQEFLRKIVYSILPLGVGVILDPFMGSGSTLAAANSFGYSTIGVEINSDFFHMASQSILKLSNVKI
jgi:site-specific DNA-methyltransferase (adenine-specific)